MSAATSFDELIALVEEWVETGPDMLVDLLLEGDPSPFAAKMSESDKLQYYSAQFFNADGSPNNVGRDQELNRLGLDEYLKTLKKMNQIRGLYAPPPGMGEGIG